MTELSESEGSGPRRTGAGGDDSGPEAPDRPKLVAVPGPEARADGAGAPADAVAQPAVEDPDPAPDEADPHARRLELERSLRPPRGPAGGLASSGSTAARPLAGDAPVASASESLPANGSDHPPGSPAPEEMVRALRTELAMRATAEAGLRARVVDAESRLAARVVLSQRTAETLREVRAELQQLAALTAGERSRRVAAERRVAELERELAEIRGRSGDADREIASLRDSLEQLRTPPDDAGSDPPGDAGTVVPDRLTDALSRLRANAEPAEGRPGPVEGQPAAVDGPPGPVEGQTAPAAVVTSAPLHPSLAPAPVAVASLPATVAAVTTVAAPAISATLAGPFRTLTRRDPALAGRLAISLLGMERVAYPHPMSFDLLLGQGGGCLQVTSSESRTDVVAETTPRPLEQVGFRVVGGPDRLARLLVAGRLRRRLGFGVARVRGDRDGLAALDALLALPLDLPALVDGGMLADTRSLLSLVAAMVRPEWTRGAHFALSHRDGDSSPTYLRFSGGRRPEVTPTAPAGPIATVISCEEHDLASVLTGAMAPGTGSAQVLGDVAPLHQLQSWIKRAQSG